MPASLSKVGQSLLKFVKPARITPAHRTPRNSAPLVVVPVSPDLDTRSQFKRARPPVIGQPANTASSADAAIGQTLESEQAFRSLTLKPNANWVELVIVLLGACRKVAHKLRARGGAKFYTDTLAKQSAQKIKTRGAIVDISADLDASATVTKRKIDGAA
jgi:hypothetical protein